MSRLQLQFLLLPRVLCDDSGRGFLGTSVRNGCKEREVSFMRALPLYAAFGALAFFPPPTSYAIPIQQFTYSLLSHPDFLGPPFLWDD